MMAAAETVGRPIEEFGNDSRVEALWAIKAMEHAEVYFNILCSVEPSRIPRLSPSDDEIVEAFREAFPSMDVRRLEEIRDLKSEDMKAKWRAFCEKFKHIEDHSFATLLRLDCEKDYSEENSVIVTKIQFYAIELVRNRTGFNDSIRFKYKPTARNHRKQPSTEDPYYSEKQRITKEVEHELQQILSGSI